MHLIELLSGRLAIGAHQYRRLTRRPAADGATGLDQELKPLAIAVAGARGAGKSRLIAPIKQACLGEMNLIKARVEPLGLAPGLLDRLKEARWIESPGLSAGRRRRNTARSLPARVGGDGRRRVRLARSGHRRMPARPWSRPGVRPCLGPMVSRTSPARGAADPGGDHRRGPSRVRRRRKRAPTAGTTDQALRESLVRTQVDALRAVLPPTFRDFAAVGLGESPFGVIEHVVPTLAPLLLQAERTALLRRLHQLANQSKAGRLVRQLGEHGRSLWDGLKARHKSATKSH